MGALQRGQLIQEAALLAGVEPNSITNRLRSELNTWLRSQYDGFLWPFLKKTQGNIALGVGVTSLSFGGGDLVPYQVTRIFDPVSVYSSDLSSYGRMRIQTFWDMTHPDIMDTVKGVPYEVRCEPASTEGKWNLMFNRNPDRALLIAIAYQHRPAQLGKDDDVPLYPNDATIIQHLKTYCLRYKKDPTAPDEALLTRNMVVDDRVKYGALNGHNEEIGLDPKIFR